MKRINFISILLLFWAASNIYSAPRSVETPIIAPAYTPCGSSVTPRQLYNSVKDQMTEDEFCACFPCLCCDCHGNKVIKENNAPCKLSARRYTKKCCAGTNNEEEVSWWCCEPEPPCDCCECDVDDCPRLMNECVYMLPFKIRDPRLSHYHFSI